MKDAEVERARMLLQAGQFRTALAVLKTDLSSSTPSTEALLIAAAAFNGVNEHPEALRLAKAVISHEPTNERAFIAAAAALVGMRDGNTAIDYADEAIRLDPLSLYAHAWRVEAGLLVGELEAGAPTERSVIQLLELAPDDSGVLTLVADLHRQRRRFAEAAELYQRALQIDPTNRSAANNRVVIMLRRWRPVAAVRSLAALLRAHPLMETAQFNTIAATKLWCRIATLATVVSLYVCMLALRYVPAFTKPILIGISYLAVLAYAAVFLRAAGPGVRRYLRDLPTIDPVLTAQLAMLALLPPALAVAWLLIPEAAPTLTVLAALGLTVGLAFTRRNHGTWTKFVEERST
ncbi:Tetratricopeptide (TPR) repeat [Microbacterium azadirachtae]|uniref:Tetratricopeptide (TPR) repeat n=1 Tax=Microbacterium azadirachtae TaxID=582680 RepID=A0A1I6HVN1_9MICO|nr:tetratricopeptide repeat protein [Microbacterium azadirachtae]SFR58494.1 Tetratricopeptide (TPR) repeat [Microbacterium azadirachtae]